MLDLEHYNVKERLEKDMAQNKLEQTQEYHRVNSSEEEKNTAYVEGVEQEQKDQRNGS